MARFVGKSFKIGALAAIGALCFAASTSRAASVLVDYTTAGVFSNLSGGVSAVTDGISLGTSTNSATITSLLRSHRLLSLPPPPPLIWERLPLQ